MGFLDRLQHGWNAFMNKDPTREYQHYGMSQSYRPDRPRFSRGNERSIVTAIYNRIALDVAAITIKHCDMDEHGRYLKDRESNLNNCFNLEANIDQTSRAFIQDVVMSMLDEGVVALVPIDTTFDPETTGAFDILTMRTGKVIQWYPKHVKVRVYNDRTGEKEELILPKNRVGIIENPLYAVINEPNSTMQRLIRKLALLDMVDEKGSSGKLDLIIQLPYVIKTEARRNEAEKRRKDIEMQLSSSTYGIAYTDGTERITQLNRPVENNLLKQIEYLTNVLYSQLSFHQTILDGTADEKTMLNYNNRLIEPIVSAIVDECRRKFLTKTARSQKQTIMYFTDPFKLVPVDQIANIADKFTRNEILSSNELRQIIGRPPSSDPKADELRNSNLNHPESENEAVPPEGRAVDYNKAVQDLNKFDAELDKLEKKIPKGELKHYASPYYDPVKAHEYYMKNRELKGRKSTAELNDEGKAAAEYVKKQLDTERDAKVEEHRTTTQSRIDAEQASMRSKIENSKESIESKLESHKTTTASKIESLREKLNNLSMEEWDQNAESILSELAELRASNDVMREQLAAEHAANSDKLRGDFNTSRDTLRGEHKTEKTRLKEEYEEKYLSELDNLKSNSKYLK